MREREIKSRLSLSIFNSWPGRCAHRAGSKTRVPDSDVVFPENKLVSRRSTPLTFHGDFCVSTMGKGRHQTIQQKKPQHCRGAVGTSTRAVACAVASQPQLLLCAHPPMLSHGYNNLLTDSNDLLLSSSALLFWRSPHDAWSRAREPSPVSRSPCRRFVSFSLSQWQPHSPSLGRVVHGRSCDPLRRLSGSRRDQRKCRPSTSAEYQLSRRSEVHVRRDCRAAAL